MSGRAGEPAGNRLEDRKSPSSISVTASASVPTLEKGYWALADSIPRLLLVSELMGRFNVAVVTETR